MKNLWEKVDVDAKHNYDHATVYVSVDDLRELLEEARHNAEQITDLQQRLTAYEIEMRAVRARETTLSGQVAAFMYALNQPVREKPGIPSDELVRLRAELILEEAFEYITACLDLSDVRDSVNDPIANYPSEMIEAIRRAPIRVDLVKLADACADLDYVVTGARHTFGISGRQIADEVHYSNLLKLGGPVDPKTGKVLKPKGWTPPDVEGCLREQGWDGVDAEKRPWDEST